MAKQHVADPKLQLENLRKEEQLLLSQIKDEERKLRLLLSEIAAVRNLKEEAFNKIEHETFDEDDDEQEIAPQVHDEEVDLESLENIVGEAQSTRSQSEDSSNPLYQSNAQPLYNVPTADEVVTASNTSSIDELYRIADLDNPSPADQQRFFEIAGAVVKSNTYEFSGPVQQSVNNTYNAVKAVLEKRPELAQTYKAAGQPSSLADFLTNVTTTTAKPLELKKPDIKTSLVDQYK